MKKTWMILAAVVMTAAAVLSLPLCTGCSASPDEKLRAQVPAAAEQLAFLDLAALMTQEPYASAVREGVEELKKGMRKEGLPESLLKSRGILFGCAKEKWAGAVIQTTGGEARQLYEYLLKKSQEEQRQGSSTLQVRDERGVRSFTVGGKDGTAGGYAVLHDDNLLTVAIQMGKLDPARFKPGKNALSKKLKMEGALFALALKFELPDMPEIRQNAEQLYQMVPALRKLENIFAALPAGAKEDTAEIRLEFADADSANQFKAVVDMGAGAAAKNDRELAKLANWKVDGKALVISVAIQQTVNTLNNAMTQSRARARQISSISNLKQIGFGIAMYAGDHSDNCPADFAALVKGGYLKDDVLLSPADSKRKTASGKTSYAYVGKGLKVTHASQIPVAFEKPDLIGADGRCGVLFLDGHVETRNVRGKTCKAIAEELLQGVAGEEKAKQLVLANAAAADRDL